jgi:hypothetical protein
MLVRVAIVLVALSVTACSAPYVAPTAPCESAGLRAAQREDPNARLAASFMSDVADVASWQSNGYGNGALRVGGTPPSSAAPLDRVDVCWYEGAFYLGGHPKASVGATIRPWDRLLVVVDRDGVAQIVSAGFRETTPFASPAHGP